MKINILTSKVIKLRSAYFFFASGSRNFRCANVYKQTKKLCMCFHTRTLEYTQTTTHLGTKHIGVGAFK